MLSCQSWILKVINKKSAAGIYIHIPFCVRKCSYCDFYSIPVPEKALLESYTNCLIKEVKAQAPYWQDRKFTTIYLGGGTPSLLSPTQIGRILAEIFGCYEMLSEPEISMEANPATLSLPALRELKQAGINRLSLGVQSFQDDELQLLGRIHGVQEVWETVASLERSGFVNYNIDLIYGIPGQSLQTWIENLGMAIKCHPQHISSYLLQLDPSTPLARRIKQGNLPEADEDLEADMYYNTIDYLHSEGYQHYEISNFSQPDYACRHNLIYWQAHEYLGLGAGAVSYRDGQRTINQADFKAYLDDINRDQGCTVEILETMSPREKFLDAIILGLRLTAGIRPEELNQRFGIDFSREYHATIEKLTGQGLLNVEEDRIALSRKGYFLSNQVLCQFAGDMGADI